jgi:hypothetical protein
LKQTLRLLKSCLRNNQIEVIEAARCKVAVCYLCEYRPLKREKRKLMIVKVSDNSAQLLNQEGIVYLYSAPMPFNLITKRGRKSIAEEFFKSAIEKGKYSVPCRFSLHYGPALTSLDKHPCGFPPSRLRVVREAGPDEFVSVITGYLHVALLQNRVGYRRFASRLTVQGRRPQTMTDT